MQLYGMKAKKTQKKNIPAARLSLYVSNLLNLNGTLQMYLIKEINDMDDTC